MHSCILGVFSVVSMKNPVGLMPVARIKATPVSALCMYSDVVASVLLACFSGFIFTGLPKISMLQFFEIKIFCLRNYHKLVEAVTGPSPGFKCADCQSSTVGLDQRYVFPMLLSVKNELRSKLLQCISYLFSYLSFNTLVGIELRNLKAK